LDKPSCQSCIYFEKFDKREYELSNYGCKHSDYAGYVDLATCQCGGLGYFRKEEK
jgi:hypothetical protein